MKFTNVSRAAALFLFAVLAISLSGCLEDDRFNEVRDDPFFLRASRLNIEAGESITYKDSSDMFQSIEWEFDGANIATSTEREVTVQYDEPGTFLTFATITLTNGDSRRRRLEVEVLPTVMPDFTASSTQVVRGATVGFTNTTTGVGAIPPNRSEADSMVLHLWVFPGSTTGNDTVEANNPSAQYLEEGSYDVSLTVIRRATGSRVTVVKENYIQVVTNPILQPNFVGFDRDGQSLLMRLPEVLDAPSGDGLAAFKLTSEDGSAEFSLASASIPGWSAGNIVQFPIPAGMLTDGTNYKLSFDGDVGFPSAAILGTFETENMTYFSGQPAWAPIVYDNGGNINKTVMIGDKSFTWETTGARGSWDNNQTINIFNVFDDFLSTQWDGGVPYTVDVTPQGDASFDDIRASGVEAFFINPGTTISFSHPVTDIRYHRLPDMQIDLAMDGRSMVLTNVERGGPIRFTLILEDPAAFEGFSMVHDQAQDINIFVTSAPK